MLATALIITGYSSCSNDDDNQSVSVQHAVDLGLSVKWADCNVGATTPGECGSYFSWGESAVKTDYSENTTKWFNVSYSSLKSQGVIDSTGTLTAAYDAATQNWGSKWRMPTYSELDELMTKCTWTWTAIDSIKGFQVKGPNGKSIFLPAAGGLYSTELHDVNNYGFYWSSAAYDNLNNASYLAFSSTRPGVFSDCRFYGFTVRAVLK